MTSENLNHTGLSRSVNGAMGKKEQDYNLTICGTRQNYGKIDGYYGNLSRALDRKDNWMVLIPALHGDSLEQTYHIEEPRVVKSSIGLD